jgi:hypothetical protein
MANILAHCKTSAGTDEDATIYLWTWLPDQAAKKLTIVRPKQHIKDKHIQPLNIAYLFQCISQ